MGRQGLPTNGEDKEDFMPTIELRRVTNFICQDVNLKIFDGEAMAIWGPTGAGKTTLLNTTAGLIGYQGEVFFDDKAMEGIPSSRRGVGFLFQNLALFPHLDVASNVGYGLRVRKERANGRVDELLRLMKVEHLKHRYPKNLSGGEKQRVALARTLATSPNILLLDEPFNSLDNQTCRHLIFELRHIQRRLGITMILVTHNPVEAKDLADRVAIMDKGRIKGVMPSGSFFSSKDIHSHINDSYHDLAQPGSRGQR